MRSWQEKVCPAQSLPGSTALTHSLTGSWKVISSPASTSKEVSWISTNSTSDTSVSWSLQKEMIFLSSQSSFSESWIMLNGLSIYFWAFLMKRKLFPIFKSYKQFFFSEMVAVPNKKSVLLIVYFSILLDNILLTVVGKLVYSILCNDS